MHCDLTRDQDTKPKNSQCTNYIRRQRTRREVVVVEPRNYNVIQHSLVGKIILSPILYFHDAYEDTVDYMEEIR